MKHIVMISGLALMSLLTAQAQEDDKSVTKPVIKPIEKPSGLQVQTPPATKPTPTRLKPTGPVSVVVNVNETAFDKAVVLLDGKIGNIDDEFRPDLSKPEIDAEIKKYEVEPGREIEDRVELDKSIEMMDDLFDLEQKIEPIGSVDEALLPMPDFDPSTDRQMPEPRTELEAFVTSVYFEGIPLEDARKFVGKDDAYLSRVLQDQGMVNYHPAALTILGLSGTQSAEQALVRYVVSGNERIDSSFMASKSDAVMSLGYLANVSGGKFGLKTLIETAEGGWSKQGMSWSLDYSKDPAAAPESIRRMSLIGLALSGHPDAGPVLERAKVNAEKADGEWAITAEDVSDYIEEYQMVRRLGLFEYSKGSAKN